MSRIPQGGTAILIISRSPDSIGTIGGRGRDYLLSKFMEDCFWHGPGGGGGGGEGLLVESAGRFLGRRRLEVRNLASHERHNRGMREDGLLTLPMRQLMKTSFSNL